MSTSSQCVGEPRAPLAGGPVDEEVSKSSQEVSKAVLVSAGAARRDDPELKRLQAAVDNAQGRQIHAAKKAFDDYLNK